MYNAVRALVAVLAKGGCPRNQFFWFSFVSFAHLPCHAVGPLWVFWLLPHRTRGGGTDEFQRTGRRDGRALNEFPQTREDGD